MDVDTVMQQTFFKQQRKRCTALKVGWGMQGRLLMQWEGERRSSSEATADRLSASEKTEIFQVALFAKQAEHGCFRRGFYPSFCIACWLLLFNFYLDVTRMDGSFNTWEGSGPGLAGNY